MKKSNIILSLLSNIFLIFVIAFSAIFASSRTIVYASNIINGCYYSGNQDGKKICLMINVYWGTEYVEPILNVFEKYNVKTTFFVGGVWVEKNQQLLKKISDTGHEIASHGYNHKEHGKLDFEQNYEEMTKTHELVKQILGEDMTLFAPPGGSYNKFTVAAANEMNYKCIMWTRDTIDWRDQNAELIYKRATNDMHGGDLILMHPKAKTLEALPRIIEYAVSNGFVVSTVSDTLA